MGVLSDDVVLIREPDRPGEPSMITVSCPDKTGLGCDLCRIIFNFGLSIVKGDGNTDGKWCYLVFWVSGSQRTRWNVLKKRLSAACPSVVSHIYNYACIETQEPKLPELYLLKLIAVDRMGFLHALPFWHISDVNEVLCELELTIKRVKVSTTPDGKVMDLFFLTDTRDQLHTNNRKQEILDQLMTVLGDSTIDCSIEVANTEVSAHFEATTFLPPLLTEDMFNLESPEPVAKSMILKGLAITMDNSNWPAHTVIQIKCQEHKGLLYDIMRTLKDYNIQISYGRFTPDKKGKCEVELFVMQADGKKIVDPDKKNSLCARLRMELYPLHVFVMSRGPDTELFVANPVELSGEGRPLVFYDITLALKMLNTGIFLAETGRHVIGDRVWEVYRILLDECESKHLSRNKIEDEVVKMLMGWK